MGTGPMAAGHLTRQALGFIRAADRFFYLAGDETAEPWLRSLNAHSEPLAECGSERAMVERIVAAVLEGLDVCAAFPGHPAILTGAGHEAIGRVRAAGLAARMLPGISAADCLFADLGVDPAEFGCQSYEAARYLAEDRTADPASALILWRIGAPGQPERRRVGPELGRLAEELLRIYPPEHEVLIHEAATRPGLEPAIRRLPLRDLPGAEVTPSSTLYLPPARRLRSDPDMLALLGLEEPEAGPEESDASVDGS